MNIRRLADVKRSQRYVIAVLLCFLVVILWGIRKGLFAARHAGVNPGVALSLLFDGGAPLDQLGGMTAVAVLGRAGGDHAGANLTDTILVIVLDHRTEGISMISVPRDLWSDLLRDRINSAYHYGQERSQGGGIVLAKEVLEEQLGIPIQYGLVVNFEGFTDIIDLVGGVDVEVPISFVDTQFPIPGLENDTCDGDPDFACRYETVSFTEGVQHMDGTLALKYVRSRHATGDQGTDFARSRRQQLVLLALKQKMMQPQLWIQDERIEDLLDIYKQSVDTDMTTDQLITIGKFIYNASDDSLVRISLEDQLLNPDPSGFGGRYVLVPTNGLAALHAFVREQIEASSE